MAECLPLYFILSGQSVYVRLSTETENRNNKPLFSQNLLMETDKERISPFDIYSTKDLE